MGLFARTPKRVEDVFGVAPEVLIDSYVDRGDLDEKITRLLRKKKHIALRGVSKSGKSWLRQQVIPTAIVVQCRLGKTVLDIYREALGELGIRLEVSATSESSLTGTVEATAEAGVNLIAKIAARWGLSTTSKDTSTTASLRQNINDLGFIADLIRESGRVLVIEDFHYLSHSERTRLAFDLKALWDFKTFVVIVGVWSGQNILPHLNPDLTARVREVSIVWSDEDLERVLASGGRALNLDFSDAIRARVIRDCYGNAGILQRLIEGVLEEADIEEEQETLTTISNVTLLEDAELAYAEELDTVYLEFASRVSSGIRRRQNATGIYAHAMAVIMSATDAELINGVPLDTIFRKAHSREDRIQKGNLRTVLERIEALQVDAAGRGLVLAYDESRKVVSVVDRQLLLYRKYATVPWPWEDLIAEADQRSEGWAEDPEPA